MNKHLLDVTIYILNLFVIIAAFLVFVVIKTRNARHVTKLRNQED